MAANFRGQLVWLLHGLIYSKVGASSKPEVIQFSFSCGPRLVVSIPKAQVASQYPEIALTQGDNGIAVRFV